jgi:hypothetical protein
MSGSQPKASYTGVTIGETTMSEWDKLWEDMPLPVTDQWGRTDNGPFMVFVMKVKNEGDKLKSWGEEMFKEGRKLEAENYDLNEKLGNIKRFAEGEQMLQSVTHQQIANLILKLLEDSDAEKEEEY